MGAAHEAVGITDIGDSQADGPGAGENPAPGENAQEDLHPARQIAPAPSGHARPLFKEAPPGVWAAKFRRKARSTSAVSSTSCPRAKR